MKKGLLILLCLGLSGCYYVGGGYYDEIYTTPATSYYEYSGTTYVYPATTTAYYESYHYLPLTPRPHYYSHHSSPRHHHTSPIKHHHAQPEQHQQLRPSPGKRRK